MYPVWSGSADWCGSYQMTHNTCNFKAIIKNGKKSCEYWTIAPCERNVARVGWLRLLWASVRTMVASLQQLIIYFIKALFVHCSFISHIDHLFYRIPWHYLVTLHSIRGVVTNYSVHYYVAVIQLPPPCIWCFPDWSTIWRFLLNRSSTSSAYAMAMWKSVACCGWWYRFGWGWYFEILSMLRSMGESPSRCLSPLFTRNILHLTDQIVYSLDLECVWRKCETRS